MRFYSSNSGLFLFESEKFVKQGECITLARVLQLLHSGKTEQEIRELLKEQAEPSDLDHTFTYLGLHSQNFKRAKNSGKPKSLSFETFIDPILSEKLISSISNKYDSAELEQNVHLVFLSRNRQVKTLNSSTGAVLCPVIINSDRVIAGPFLDDLNGLKNFTDFVFSDVDTYNIAPVLDNSVSADYFSERQLEAIANFIVTEIVNAFHMGIKKTILKGAKIFNLRENEITFASLAWDFHKERRVKIEHKDYSLQAPIPSKKNEIVYTEGGFRTAAAEETIAKLLPFLAGPLGILSVEKTYRISAEEGFGIHFAGGRLLTSEVNTASSRTNYYAYGKGTTELQTKVSCYAELMERYRMGTMDPIRVQRARYNEISEHAFSPQDLEPYTSRQRLGENDFEAAYEIRRTYQEYKNEPISWVPAYCMVDQKTYWLPFSYCIRPGLREETKEHEDPFCSLGSNGFAAGATSDEAIIQGTLELIERDHAAIWWFNQTVMPEIDLKSFSNSAMGRMIQYFERLGMSLKVLDLTMDFGVHVVAAVIGSKEGKLVSVGMGAHLDIETAILRALTEANQVLNVPGFFKRCSERVDSLAAEQKRFLFSCSGLKKSSDYSRWKPSNTNEILQRLVGLFRGKNMNLLVQDYSVPEMQGFSVMRATAPGLAFIWAQLANERLYKVPVQLGLLAKEKTELELNPIPFEL